MKLEIEQILFWIMVIVWFVLICFIILFNLNYNKESALVDAYCKEKFNSNGWGNMGCEVGFDHKTGKTDIYYFSKEQLEEILK